MLYGLGARDLESAANRAALQGQIGTARMLYEMTFSHREIYPAEMGCKDPIDATVGTPLGGTTLLHLCADYDELEIRAVALLDRGMDVNVPCGGGARQIRWVRCVVQHRGVTAGLLDRNLHRKRGPLSRRSRCCCRSSEARATCAGVAVGGCIRDMGTARQSIRDLTGAFVGPAFTPAGRRGEPASG
ncbi:MAG: hypothetical protein IPP47_00370 [Bryobacterales bacterium]|nr:hypothetical protein [Bryobacterales bacterium]